MKTTKKLKRLAAVLLSLAVSMTMGATAFADTTPPKATDTKTITVTNVEDGATVVAYKIAEAQYNSNGLTGYKLVDEFANATPALTIADLEKPTEAEISKIANYFAGKTPAYTLAKDATATTPATTYSKDVNAGMYVVLVTKTDSARVYNPMILSAGYTNANDSSTLSGGTVDAKSTFFTDTGYAKSTEITVDKKITGANKDGNTVKYGDTINYTIESKFPSYSEQYKAVTFKIEDTLSAGLTAPAKTGVTVKVDGVAVTESSDHYTLTIANNKITVVFADAYIKANELKDIEVSYAATVNANAETNFDPNTNTAKISYTNKPNVETADVEKPENNGGDEDTTYSYTFGIDADLGGTKASGQGDNPTSEIIKDKKETKDAQGNPLPTPTTSPIAGAEFTLYSDAACATPVTIIDKNNTAQTSGTAVSGNDGTLVMKGLAPGSYWLKETKAPAGYALEATAHTVVIAASLNNDGTLDTYTITIDGEYTNKYKATYTKNDDGTVTVTPAADPDNSGTLHIINNKLPALPSTGGLGTYLLYLMGTIVMIVGAAMFIRKRKTAKASR